MFILVWNRDSTDEHLCALSHLVYFLIYRTLGPARKNFSGALRSSELCGQDLQLWITKAWPRVTLYQVIDLWDENRGGGSEALSPWMVTKGSPGAANTSPSQQTEPKMLLGSLSAECLLSAPARTRHWLDALKWGEKREMKCDHLSGLSACIPISLQNTCHIIYCVFFWGSCHHMT